MKKESKLLDRKALLSKQDFKIEKVELEEGSYLYVRQMSGQGRDRFEQSLLKEVKKGNTTTFEQSLSDFRAKLAVSTICDENGVLILKPGDFGELSRNMTAYTLEKIINKAQEINAISEQDKDDMVKN